MDKIPFSVYDFWAYLSSGSVLVVAADYIWKFGLLSAEKVNPVLAVVLVVLTYITGHIVAHFASFFFEHTIAARLLKRPGAILLGAKPRLIAFRWLFPNYYRAFPDKTQERIRQQAGMRNSTADGEGLFLHAYAVVTSNEKLQARLDEFRNQYGFARNVAFSCCLAAMAIAVAHWRGYDVKLRWSVFALVGGVSLFYRYLKFFKQYSYELFLRYAELPYEQTKKISAGT